MKTRLESVNPATEPNWDQEYLSEPHRILEFSQTNQETPRKTT